MQNNNLVNNNTTLVNNNNNTCLGNGHLPDNLLVSHTVFLNAHNAMCSPQEGWSYYQQSTTIEDMWRKYGTRSFKVPIHWYQRNKKSKTTTISLCHEPNGYSNGKFTRYQRMGMSPQPALPFFKRIAALLNEDKQEIGMLFLETYIHCLCEANGTMDMSHDAAQATLVEELRISGLLDMCCSLSKFQMQQEATNDSTNVHVPISQLTLGHLRKSNKRLIIFTEHEMSANNYKYAHYFNHSGSGLLRCSHFTNAEKKKLQMWRPTGDIFIVGVGPSASLASNTLLGIVTSIVTFCLKYCCCAVYEIKIEGEEVIASNYWQVNSVTSIVKEIEAWESVQQDKKLVNVVSLDFVHMGEGARACRVLQERYLKLYNKDKQ